MEARPRPGENLPHSVARNNSPTPSLTAREGSGLSKLDCNRSSSPGRAVLQLPRPRSRRISISRIENFSGSLGSLSLWENPPLWALSEFRVRCAVQVELKLGYDGQELAGKRAAVTAKDAPTRAQGMAR